MEPDRATTLLADLGWLQQLARELAADPEHAADAVQDTCAVALQHGGAVIHPRAWLAAVLRNCVRLRARSRRAVERREAAAARPEAGEGTAELVQRAELQQRLVAAVLALPVHHRDAVLLRFFDGLPPRAIAARLRVPVATVHSRLQRALRQLRNELDRGPGARAAWAALAGTALPSSPWSLPALGILMQTKLKVAAAVLVAVGMVPFFWPDADAGESASAPAPPAPRAAAGGGGSDGRPGAASERPQRTQLPVAAAGDREQRALVALRGRVCDCSGLWVADVPVSVRGATDPPPARTDAAGRFELQVPSEPVSLTVDDERFVTVLGASWAPATPIEPVLVIAGVQRLAGVVRDPAGDPVAGAHIELQLPADLQARLPMLLDRTERVRWQATSGQDGSFRLPQIPRLPGAQLFAAADAYRPVTLPAPPADDERLQIVLQPFAYEQGELDGIVVDAQGTPVQGARVAMGVTSVVTGRDGRFGLSLRRAGWPTAIVACKHGHLPARVEVPADGGARRSDWPDPLVLRLGPEPQSIRGRVLDTQGKPVAGAIVWASDPTLFGIVGIVPVQTEYLLAGGELPPRTAQIPVPFADDPTKDEHFTDQMSHMKEPTACWYFVTADDAGEFEVGGLLPRDYVLRALDLGSGITGDSVPTPAGGTAEIRIAGGKVWPVVRGRVVSLRGEGLQGVDVLQAVLAFQVNERVPGGRFEGSAIRHGKRTKTGADGSFELQAIDAQHSFLSIYGDTILPRLLWGRAIGDPTAVVIEVAARCHVEVALVDPNEADAVSARDAAGEVVDISILRSGSHRAETELSLHAGRSGVFALSERATRLLLLRGGAVVREVPLLLAPGPTTLVQ